MTGYCALADHAGCPDAVTDSHACSCPCHLSATCRCGHVAAHHRGYVRPMLSWSEVGACEITGCGCSEPKTMSELRGEYGGDDAETTARYDLETEGMTSADARAVSALAPFNYVEPEHSYADNGMNDRKCLVCGLTHWSDVCAICREVRADHDDDWSAAAGDERGAEPVLSDHYFQSVSASLQRESDYFRDNEDRA